MRNIFKQNKEVFTPTSDTCNYIEIWSINTGNWEISPTNISVEDLPDNGKRKLFKNDLLVSKVRPYRWAVSFIDFDMEDLVGSWAFTVLQEKKDYKKETLMIFLKLFCIKDLLLRYNSGAMYPVIKDEDILNLKLPLISPSIQSQIASKIQLSHQLRKESRLLLEQAKMMVESEIEKK